MLQNISGTRERFLGPTHIATGEAQYTMVWSRLRVQLLRTPCDLFLHTRAGSSAFLYWGGGCRTVVRPVGSCCVCRASGTSTPGAMPTHGLSLRRNLAHAMVETLRCVHRELTTRLRRMYARCCLRSKTSCSLSTARDRARTQPCPRNPQLRCQTTAKRTRKARKAKPKTTAGIEPHQTSGNPRSIYFTTCIHAALRSGGTTKQSLHVRCDTPQSLIFEPFFHGGLGAAIAFVQPTTA